MTLRALILGLLASGLVAGLTYLNDQVWRLTFFVGNHFPISVFGGLLVFVLLINPLLGSLRLRRSELAVIVALTLIVCSIPSSGFLRTFTPAVGLPARQAESEPGWKRTNVLSYVPPVVLAAGGRYDKDVIEDFVSGRRRPDRMLAMSEIPWGGWSGPLLFWMPVLLAMSVGIICLSVIVHHQWAHNERLRYPIAQIATALMGHDPGFPVSQAPQTGFGEPSRAGAGRVFRNKAFWVGLSTVLAIHLINGWFTWNGGQGLEVPIQFDLRAIGQKWPALARAEGAWATLNPKLFFTAVAFGYFLASDVGLSLGVCSVVYTAAFLILTEAGVDISRDMGTGGLMDFQRFGGYVGVALVLLYTGRRHYAETLVAAVAPGLRKWWGGRVARVSAALLRPAKQSGALQSRAGPVWACRIMLLSLAAMVVLLWRAGLDWPPAVLFVLLAMMQFLVLSRLSAESGLFFVQPWWQPAAVVLAIFGGFALGPKALVILLLLTAVLMIDPREALMPFAVNSLKICDDAGVRPSRVAVGGAGAFVLGLAIGVPVVLWANYNYGVNTDDLWATGYVARMPFETTSREIDKLSTSGTLAQSIAMDTPSRLAAAAPSSRFLLASGVGLAAVLALSVLRLRLTWWPVHPILLLVWGTYPMYNFAPSFFVGWAIKTAVTRLGGAQKYRRLMPLMIGVIAGDLLGGLFWMAQGGIYHALTGVIPPRTYRIFPA